MNDDGPLRGTCAFIDLDGTLTDPARGIIASLRYALQRVGRPVDDGADLTWVIGPPLRETLRQILGSGESVETAVGIYRERYAEGGLFDAHVYPGTAQALDALSAAGCRLLLCTSKVRDYAVRILDHFGLADRFSAVYGADINGRHDDKADLIAHMLDVERIAPSCACMIGDRMHDVRAARANSVAAIGALWGYGSREELTAAGAQRLIETPADILACAVSLLASRA